MPNVLKFMTVLGVPIFQTGRWHGIPYTRDDIDEMIANFRELRPKGFQPTVVVGHEEPDEALNWMDSSGIPSAGDVSGLTRRGDILYADFVDVPELIGRLLNARRYKKISVELITEMADPHTEKKYRLVLKRVALLGGEMPEVHTLPEIPIAMQKNPSTATALAAADTVLFNFQEAKMPEPTTQTPPADGGTPAAPADGGEKATGTEELLKQLQDSVAKIAEELAGLKTRLDDVEEKLKEPDEESDKAPPPATPAAPGATPAAPTPEMKKMAAEIKTLKSTNKQGKITRELDALKRAGKVPPVLQEAGLASFAASLDDDAVRKFGAKTLDGKTPLDAFLTVLSALPVTVKFVETAAAGADAETPEDTGLSGLATPASIKQDAAIRKFQAEKGIKTYAEAMVAFEAAKKPKGALN